jgi:hypothetical protein
MVTVEPSFSFSFSRSAASIAYSSNGLRTVSTPVRTRRLVAGSMRLSAFVSGTSLTVTRIFSGGNLRTHETRRLAGYVGNLRDFSPTAAGPPTYTK